MTLRMILTGDVNLLGVEDPAAPFRRMEELRKADVVFGNLECCLFEPREARVMMPDDKSGFEGIYVPLAAGEALRLGGFHVVGNANNQNYGAEAIVASNARLDALGIQHAGTGVNTAAARAPVIVERKGTRFGFLQRTSQYWPNNHEAGERFPGVAALKAYTAYQPPYYKDNKIPPNRPGAPARIVTWTDPDYLAAYKEDIAALRVRADVVVASHHWGYAEDVLQYQREIAHAAIDSGADVVIGHGPHFPLAIEVYRGKPIFYGLGSFCFVRSNKKYHKGWIGMIANVTVEEKKLIGATSSFVRQNERMEVCVQPLENEGDALTRLQKLSDVFGTRLSTQGNEIAFPVVAP